MTKISYINERLEKLLNGAEIREIVNPGTAIRILPSGKELSRLAHLASQLCALGRRSRKTAVTNILEKSREKRR